MSNWEKLCEAVRYLLDIRADKEESFHLALEDLFKTAFRWPCEHIKHEKRVQMGSKSSRMDTVLEGDGFGVIIEMKTLDNRLDGDEGDQLIAYMSNYYTARNGIRCKYGLLIGQKIKVYFQGDPDKRPELVATFSFDRDSKDGNSLFGILSYDVCSDEKLTGYMKEARVIEEPPVAVIDEALGGQGKIFDDDFYKTKKAFEAAGFAMRDLTGEDFLMSTGKNGVSFIPHFRQDDRLPKSSPRLWQIVWENTGYRDRAWFGEQYPKIKNKYGDCYITFPGTRRAKIWIPTVHRHLDDGVLKELIKIVNDRKALWNIRLDRNRSRNGDRHHMR